MLTKSCRTKFHRTKNKIADCETTGDTRPIASTPPSVVHIYDEIGYFGRFSGGTGMPGHLEGGQQPLPGGPFTSRTRVQ